MTGWRRDDRWLVSLAQSMISNGTAGLISAQNNCYKTSLYCNRC
jgi:hypothetical protein